MLSFRRLALSLTASATLLCSAFTANAQSVRVVSDVLVDATPSRAILEPHLVVDPRNPDRLLAAVMVTPPIGASTREQGCASFLSTDGGAHWTRHDFPVLGCYDPWLAFLPDGTAIFSALGSDPSLAGDGNGLLVYRSPNGGRTWAARPAGLSWGWDHPMFAVENVTPKRAGWVYLAASRDQSKEHRYHVEIARSVDGGKTFDVPRKIAPDDQLIKAEPPVVLSDGTLIVPYVEITEFDMLLPKRRAWLVRSPNGIDFGPPTPIGDACGPPPTFLMSSFARDASAGPSRDRLYFSCTMAATVGIAVTHSVDAGATWSAPTVVAPAPRGTTVNRWLMASAVSSMGAFGVVWRERRGSSGCDDIYIAASFDGGNTFSAPARVSQAPSCPDRKLSGPYGQYGDYFAIAADSRGRFRVAWADARTGLFQLRTALVELEPAPTR